MRFCGSYHDASQHFSAAERDAIENSLGMLKNRLEQLGESF
jgi:hypothetical protein